MHAEITKIQLQISGLQEQLLNITQKYKEVDAKLPYLVDYKVSLITTESWNPNYDQSELCKCGHAYHRHFDAYEDNSVQACKHCGYDECGEFTPVD